MDNIEINNLGISTFGDIDKFKLWLEDNAINTAGTVISNPNPQNCKYRSKNIQ